MINGDEDFKDFLDKDGNGLDNSTIEMIIVINAIKAKITAVSDFYKETLSIYNDIPNDDPIKENLRKFLQDLIQEAKQSLTQFDYAVLPEEDSTPEDMEGDEYET